MDADYLYRDQPKKMTKEDFDRAERYRQRSLRRLQQQRKDSMNIRKPGS